LKVEKALSILRNNKHETLWRAKIPKIQNANMNGVISLIQELDKYRQMWEELEEIRSNSTAFAWEVLTDIMNKLEQKYFLKEVANEGKTNRTL